MSNTITAMTTSNSTNVKARPAIDRTSAMVLSAYHGR